MKIPLPDGTGYLTLRYLYPDEDRHGTQRVYFQRHRGDKKIRLTAPPGSPEFLEQYKAAMEGWAPTTPMPDPPRKPAATEGANDPRSFRYLCTRYFGSAEFKQLDESTQHRRRMNLDKICDEKIDGVQTGPLPYALMQPAHVREIRDVKASTPAEANRRLKDLRAVFKYACDETVKLASSNPTLTVKKLPPKRAGGWHAWTVEEILQFMRRHPADTKAGLAIALLYWLGVRKSDVVRLGRQMETPDGFIRWKEHKGRKRSDKMTEREIEPELRAVLDLHTEGKMTYLLTKHGEPYTAEGFGNWFKDRCVEAGLTHCSAHGVRKGAATKAADEGASELQLMAMHGWTHPNSARPYTRNANRKKLAADGGKLLKLPGQTENKSLPLSPGVAEGGRKTGSNPLK